ncbi:uncharacterized protein LOC106670879 [Cimex lectularius]|uniref:Apolipophorin-III n=1 Tax=Cimex lectularius TaxID=79782 RepID=A0A8I6S2L9_CIMLE|nr:uncharacterized protein LOC106670879 [Cimex lectularius]
MNPIYFVFAAILVVQCSAETPVDTLQEFVKQGQAKIDEAVDAFKKEVGLSKNPDGAEIVKVVREQNDKLFANFEEAKKKLEDQLKSRPELNDAVAQVKAKLDELGADLREKSPVAFDNVQKYGDELKSFWETFTQSMEQQYKSFTKKGGKRDEVENFFKDVIDKGASLAKELQTKVEETVRKHQESN